jgi:hypothetical protein
MFAERRVWRWRPRGYVRAWLLAIATGLSVLILVQVLSHDWDSALTAAIFPAIFGGLSESYKVWRRGGRLRVNRRLAAFLPPRRTPNCRARYVSDDRHS